MSKADAVAQLMAKRFRELGRQARTRATQLRADPSAADTVADYADALTAVAEQLGCDVMPVGALLQLVRAHGLLLATYSGQSR